MKNKILAFAALVQTQSIQRLQEQHLDCLTNIANAHTRVIEGSKYTKVDIGTSGRYMVENATGNIFGIKAYGQIHKGHFYGTVDTTADYFWGNYYPQKADQTPLPAVNHGCAAGSCPALTFAPRPVVVHTTEELREKYGIDK